MNQDWLTLAVGLAFFYLILLSIRRRREGIRYSLRRFAILAVAYIGTIAYLNQAGWNPLEAIIGGIVAGLIVDTFIRPRSRYIARSERTKVIGRFESETGEKFNPRIHEIDHAIPFSKGGSNTSDNLRVVKRRENRSKGAKSPWWDLLGR